MLTNLVINFFHLGGESAWGEAFKDEFKPNLIHQGRKDDNVFFNE